MQIPDLPDLPTDSTALARLLSLPSTWRVQRVDLSGETPVIYATLDGPTLPPEPCEHCGERCWKLGKETRTWHYARSVGGRATVVRLRCWRFVCRSCTRTRGHRYAKVLPELKVEIGRYAIYHTVADTARAFGLGHRTTRDIAVVMMEQWVQERVIEPPQYVGVDVTFKGQMALCCVVDVARGRLIELLDSGVPGELTRYLDTVARTWPDLRCVAIDADKRAKTIIQQALPGTQIVLDRYHVMQIVNKRMLVFLEAYKRAHGVAADGRVLLDPELDTYPVLAARLTAGGHGRLLDLFEYARGVRVVYMQVTAAEAEAAWDAWRERMPPELTGVLGRSVKDLNRHWRTELCAAVGYRMQSRKSEGEVLVGTNIVEALHNRARRVVADSRRITFGLLRLRLLMMESGVDLNERYLTERARLRAIRRAS